MQIVFHRGWNGVEAGTVAAEVDMKTVTSKLEGTPETDMDLNLQFLVDGIRDGTLQVKQDEQEAPVAERLAAQRKSRKPEVAITDE